MHDSIVGVVQHWPGSTGTFVVHWRRMRCRLEVHYCWCSCGTIQGSHEYAQLWGRLYHQCTQGHLPLGTIIEFSLFKPSVCLEKLFMCTFIIFYFFLWHNEKYAKLTNKQNLSMLRYWGIWMLLGSKTLDLNVLELQFVMLANHDQNV